MIVYGGEIGVVRLRAGGDTEAMATIEAIEPFEDPRVFFTITVPKYLKDPMKIYMSLGDVLVMERVFRRAASLMLREGDGA